MCRRAFANYCLLSSDRKQDILHSSYCQVIETTNQLMIVEYRNEHKTPISASKTGSRKLIEEEVREDIKSSAGAAAAAAASREDGKRPDEGNKKTNMNYWKRTKRKFHEPNSSRLSSRDKVCLRLVSHRRQIPQLPQTRTRTRTTSKMLTATVIVLTALATCYGLALSASTSARSSASASSSSDLIIVEPGKLNVSRTVAAEFASRYILRLQSASRLQLINVQFGGTFGRHHHIFSTSTSTSSREFVCSGRSHLQRTFARCSRASARVKFISDEQQHAVELIPFGRRTTDGRLAQ